MTSSLWTNVTRIPTKSGISSAASGEMYDTTTPLLLLLLLLSSLAISCHRWRREWILCQLRSCMGPRRFVQHTSNRRPSVPLVGQRYVMGASTCDRLACCVCTRSIKPSTWITNCLACFFLLLVGLFKYDSCVAVSSSFNVSRYPGCTGDTCGDSVGIPGLQATQSHARLLAPACARSAASWASGYSARR